MEQEILAGKDPYEEWIQMAKAGDWRRLMGTTTDAVAAKQSVESNGWRSQLPFPKVTSGGVVMARGTGGPPIEPIRTSPPRAGIPRSTPARQQRPVHHHLLDQRFAWRRCSRPQRRQPTMQSTSSATR